MEIFSGAIRDYERGVIVGDTHTFGKGTVQNLHELQGKYGAIKVTINEFYRASGASTQLKGVSSDIQLPSILEDLEIGENSMTMLFHMNVLKKLNTLSLTRYNHTLRSLLKEVVIESERIRTSKISKKILKSTKRKKKKELA